MTIELIEDTAARLRGRVRVTPPLSSPFLDAIAGRRVPVTAEALQETGSFKFRGGWAALSALSSGARRQGVIAYSSGNHAQGLARAAALQGTQAVMLMPSDAPRAKIATTRVLGAEMILHDRAGADRNALDAALFRTALERYGDGA